MDRTAAEIVLAAAVRAIDDGWSLRYFALLVVPGGIHESRTPSSVPGTGAGLIRPSHESRAPSVITLPGWSVAMTVDPDAISWLTPNADPATRATPANASPTDLDGRCGNPWVAVSTEVVLPPLE